MKKTVYFKQFLAGFFIPAAVIMAVTSVLAVFGKEQLLVSWDIMIAPFFYGLYNLLYFKIKDKYPIKNSKRRYGVHGAVIFLILTPIYFYLNSGQHVQHQGMLEVFGSSFNYWWHLTGIVYMPLLAYFWFAYLQKPLNEILGLKV